MNNATAHAHVAIRNPRKTTAEESIAILTTLHELARIGCDADLGALASRLVWGMARVVRVVAHLERKGLVHRDRVRLTMGGLAIAASLASHAAAHRDTHAA